MYSEKKVTKEDTWRPAELRKYINDKGRRDDNYGRKDDSEKRRRGGESTERRYKDLEEARKEREKFWEREMARETRKEDKKDRHAERRKEHSRDRREDRDGDRRDERDRERRRLVDGDREHRERKREKEERHERERDRDKQQDIEKEWARDMERHREDDRDKRRPDRDQERRREEREREQKRERKRYEESGVRRRDYEDEHREHGDRRHRSDYEGIIRDKESKERRRHRKHLEWQEDAEQKEEHRRHKEERERRHKERKHDEKVTHESEARKRPDPNASGEDVGHSRSDRDRAERDKHKERRTRDGEEAERRHKERRHREEDDVDRNHRKPSSDKSDRHKKKEVEPESVNDEDLAEQEYEEDFEKLEYEEDFEEVEENADEGEDDKESLNPEVEADREELTVQQRREIEAIQRAMAEENKRAGTAQFRQNMSPGEEERSKWSKGAGNNQSKVFGRGKFMDFVAAKQREVNMKVASRQKKRGAELLRLIDLDFSVSFSLLDLPPVSEYEMYIRNFGNANTKQAYVQCNEDNADRDVQTEETETCEKWTQHPPQHSGACGDPSLSQGALDKTRNNMDFDSQRLASFLRSASQVMVVLLEEDQAERRSLRELNTQTETLTFSSGSLQLNTKLTFLHGRQISLVHFSKVQRHTMLSIHLPTAKASAVQLDSNTIICMWNIWEPSRPQKTLVYDSEVHCCCFSPGKATLVFAGTSVGSVVLWDLREPASNHSNVKIGDEEWTFRQPTFSTDAVMGSLGHFSSVTSVEVLPSTVAGRLGPGAPLLASEEESSGLSFQLASLDESGVLHFWVVVDLPKGNEAGSTTDLGLRPGGKVKLLHSSSLLTAERASHRHTMKTGPLQTHLLKFLPSDSNHFFIGTNMGLVNHGTSHGLKALPRFYRFQETEILPVDVTSINFSPFRPHLFLVGCGDGSIRLHAVSREQPVAEWRSSTAGEPVVSLQWAQTRMTVFCVLDAASNLHIWDLLKNDAQPVVTERMNVDRVTGMAVFGDSGQQSTNSGVALSHESGKIELQYFTRSFAVSNSAEDGKLESLMTETF